MQREQKKLFIFPDRETDWDQCGRVSGERVVSNPAGGKGIENRGSRENGAYLIKTYAEELLPLCLTDGPQSPWPFRACKGSRRKTDKQTNYL